MSTVAHGYLSRTAQSLRRMGAKIHRLDGALVEQDIAARREEAALGLEFAKHVARITAALVSVGSNQTIDQWCKSACGCDISTMRRRKRLHKRWKTYEVQRRLMGQCGQTGLYFALSLIQDRDRAASPLKRRGSPVRFESGIGTGKSPPVSHYDIVVGDALTALPRLPPASINVVITSPPYWSSRRSNGDTGIGFEPTAGGYIRNLVSIFGQVRRVLRNDGILWVSIDDSHRDGGLLFMPARLGMAMQDDHWVCRSQIIWRKKGGGRPESVGNRTTKDYEVVLMFTKQRSGYVFESDHMRIPLVGPHGGGGRRKPKDRHQHDFNRNRRVWGNPMGRSSGSVWDIAPAFYTGGHHATMPIELVRRLLLISCPEPSTVLDCFAGAGTTLLTALELGHRAVGIEISEAYAREARRRIDRELLG